MIIWTVADLNHLDICQKFKPSSIIEYHINPRFLIVTKKICFI